MRKKLRYVRCPLETDISFCVRDSSIRSCEAYCRGMIRGAGAYPKKAGSAGIVQGKHAISPRRHWIRHGRISISFRTTAVNGPARL
jgi:hypothetical protein